VTRAQANPNAGSCSGVQRLFHIARRADWERAQREGAYRVSTLGKQLDEVGFIHLSFAHQVKAVADALYRGMPDLVLLELDPDRLGVPVVVEEVEGAGERFPHLYGEFDPRAVIAAGAYEPRNDGTFEAVDTS
jgi:glutathione S-transferase